MIYIPYQLSLFQFTPLREGRLGLPDAHNQRGVISIHAPPRGATPAFPPSRTGTCRFQFTPLREGRPQHQFLSRDSPNFNSRPSARGDATEEEEGNPLLISIHAPPRGATTRRDKTMRDVLIFQFTPLREGRRCGKLKQSTTRIFQFTPLREGRRHLHRHLHRHWIFQFTPLREGRPACERLYLLQEIFQFTPLREGRLESSPNCGNAGDFNSRPSARGDGELGTKN